MFYKLSDEFYWIKHKIDPFRIKKGTFGAFSKELSAILRRDPTFI